MIENYLNIMNESLQKKNTLLDKITENCEKQEALLKQEELSFPEFDALMTEKDRQAAELSKLDDGFEVLYEKVKEQLQNGKKQYRQQILSMQALIKEITEKSNHIQAMEERNKYSMEAHLRKERGKLQMSRQASVAAYNYYKSASSGERHSILDKKN